MISSFKVKPIKFEWSGLSYDGGCPNIPEVPGDIFNKEWIVVAIENTGFGITYQMDKDTGYRPIVPSSLFLLIREGEPPFWWPAIHCQVTGRIKE